MLGFGLGVLDVNVGQTVLVSVSAGVRANFWPPRFPTQACAFSEYARCVLCLSPSVF